MKAWKKALSLALALTLSTALFIPRVFAADETPEGEVSINTKAEPTILAKDSFQLRGVIEIPTDDDAIYSLVRETEPTTYPLSVYALPLGTVLTFRSWDISLTVWSDPDGDGIYDVRLCSQENGPLPANAPGPFECNIDTGEYASTVFSVLGNNWVSSFNMPEHNVYHLSAAYLTRMFGSNALVQVTTLSGGAHFFMLTGEKADPALLEGSNILITDAGSVATNWAAPMVSQAEEQKLVPDTLYGLDLTRDVTRAQFAGVAVKLYEAMSGKKIPLPDESQVPFEDISGLAENADIQKAYAMGFTTGTSATTFSPETLLTREQAATMLSRVYQKLGGTVAAQTPGSFADNSSISPWAKDAVYFMSEKGIVQGVGQNRFDPQSNAQSQMALVIALRMLQNLK